MTSALSPSAQSRHHSDTSSISSLTSLPPSPPAASTVPQSVFICRVMRDGNPLIPTVRHSSVNGGLLWRRERRCLLPVSRMEDGHHHPVLLYSVWLTNAMIVTRPPPHHRHRPSLPSYPQQLPPPSPPPLHHPPPLTLSVRAPFFPLPQCIIPACPALECWRSFNRVTASSIAIWGYGSDEMYRPSAHDLRLRRQSHVQGYPLSLH
jgi:hypothetical protein